MTGNDCVVNVEPSTEDMEEMSYIMCLMDIHRYVVSKGHQRVLDDLKRLIAAQERPLEPFKAYSRETPEPLCPSIEGFVSGGHLDRMLDFARDYRASQETIDSEEQLSYDPRNFGPDPTEE